MISNEIRNEDKTLGERVAHISRGGGTASHNMYRAPEQDEFVNVEVTGGTNRIWTAVLVS